MYQISGGGALTRQNISQINANFAEISAGFTPGNIIYCWPSFGPATGVPDGSLEHPYTDIQSAYGAGRNGKNDVIVLVGNGAAGGSARLSATLTWAKDALHLIGVASPGLFAQRARIAPTSGVTAFANFFVLSGNGCYFQNIEWFQGFGTGVAASICVNVTGSRNVFQNCGIHGMGDDASAQDTGSRSLKIGSGGSGENLFVDCTIGLDTVTRTVANASLELAGATPRNVFRNCIFPFMTSAAGVLGILGTGAGCVDRENYFQGCLFTNAIKSTSTGMTCLASFTSASPGGALVFDATCGLMGMTKVGDTNALANSYILGAAPSAAAGLLGVNPS